MKVQEYIKEFGWDALSTSFDISVKVYEKEGIAKLDYSVLSPKNHPIVMECRGLILSYPDPRLIVARPFTRFFNLTFTHD